MACEARPLLDAHHQALTAWIEALPEDDSKPSTPELVAHGSQHWATAALGVNGQRY
ncbi:hypothetical protein [Vulcanococcus limneticus]|uniref:hypothetical protein n=1 Tax=Vulcanococcus limneticus TaxID=2170428 RepID=UPI00398C0980